ncbi:MAG: lysine--tRNA ligase [Candidatus Kerfeldbacteria bacterium]
MSRLEEEYSTRKEKLNKLKSTDTNPFPAKVERTHTVNNALMNFDQLAKKDATIFLVGRLKSIRLHGGSCFANIDDGSDAIQIYIKKDIVGDDKYNDFKDLFDIGDFIEVNGKLSLTKRGEKTLLVSSFRILTKSLLPLPEKWHGLSDIEIRYRKRYLDLISNPEVKDIFKKRFEIIKTIREFLDDDGFIEVETPILQAIPGGANARPFSTHHNALDTNFFLRIAPELYLKRLIIGGMEKVYEISRCFRNEGIDKNHNPEFTQVEFYAAYWDYEKMMNFTEQLLEKIVMKVHGKLTFEFEGKELNFTPPFNKISFADACVKYAKIDIDKLDHDGLFKEAKKYKLDVDKSFNKAKILDEIFKDLVRPYLIQPTFVTDHPLELSPLAKKKEGNKNYVERFQIVVGGSVELCNAFSELNDPIDQAERFDNQEKMRSGGDDEAQRIDKDFIEALEHGMPPTSGIGIGIDRLTALLIDSHNLKEVILFPTLKPKKENE